MTARSSPVLILIAGCAALASSAAWPCGPDPAVVRVTLSLPRTHLKEVTGRIAAATGLRIDVDAQIMDDPITCFVRNRSADEVVSSIARVMRYRLTRSGDAYRLRLESGVAAAVERLQQLDELEEQRSQAGAGVVRQALSRLLQEDPSVPPDPETAAYRRAAPTVIGVLKSLSPQQLDVLASAAPYDTGVLNATGPVDWSGRFFYRSRLSDLPGEARESVSEALRNRDPGGRPADPVVGIIAGGGTLTLGVQRFNRRGEEDVELLDGFVSGGTAQQELDRQFARMGQELVAPAERLQRDEAQGWLDPDRQELPAFACRTWERSGFMLLAESRAAKEQSGPVLGSLAKRPGVSVIADCFVNTSFGASPPLFGHPPLTPEARRQLQMIGVIPPPPTAVVGPGSAAVWARRIARSFGRRFRCSDGLLLMQSKRFVYDRAAEPSRQTVLDLLERKRKRGRLELPDYAEMASKFSVAQLRALRRFRAEDGASLMWEADRAETQRSLLLLLAAAKLSPGSSADRGSVDMAGLPARAGKFFSRLLASGDPIPAATQGAASAAISWRVRGDTATIELTDAASGARSTHTLFLGSR